MTASKTAMSKIMRSKTVISKSIWPLLVLLLTTMSAADSLYLADSLLIELSINGGFDLVAEGNAPQLQEVTAELLLFPQDDFRQELVRLETAGQHQTEKQLDKAIDKVTFTWNDQKIETKKFGYSAQVRTRNERVTVSKKISFPLSEAAVQGLEQYLQPTKTIDSNNPAIIAQATELAEGEDDLFKVVFKIAHWVDENVNYDLTTLTAETSQKASWVLEHKRGVCDEMTSLFVAMLRSLGIPARFVSGISYTTSDLFTDPWQPHGWAEVYFPDVGWVSFDITFGEYGYVDVTHIKLRDGFDPQEPATRLEWLGRDIDLQTKALALSARVLQQGVPEEEEIQLEQELLTEEAGFGSYNLVKGILKNKANYYAATTLKIAVPGELEITGTNKRTLLLGPKEVKESYWLVKVPANLDEQFIYTFPVLLYSEKNVSIQDQFTVQSGGQYYFRSEVESLLVKDEEKTYSRRVTFNCDYPQKIKVRQRAELRCTVKNAGNTNLQDLSFCLEGVCDLLDLPINQEKSAAITLSADAVGWNKAVVSAENDLVEKKAVFEYQVLDNPTVNVSVDFPATVTIEQAADQMIPLTIRVAKSSYSTPRQLVLLVKGLGSQHKIEAERVVQEQTFPLELEGARITWNNEIKIDSGWQDEEGNTYSDQQTIILKGKALTWTGKLKLLQNKILEIFYR